MSVQSKLTSPYALSHGRSSSRAASFGDQSLPPSQRGLPASLLEHKLDGARFSSSSSAHARRSRPSGSLPGYDRKSRVFVSGALSNDPFPATIFTNEDTRVLLARPSHDNESDELLELRTENERLKRRFQDLQDHSPSASYVFIFFCFLHEITSYYSLNYQARLR